MATGLPVFGTERAELRSVDKDDVDLPLAGIRTLVVEDDPQGAKLLRIVLEQAGAIVRVVAEAGQVRRGLSRFAAQLVLLDLLLPDAHGFDVLRDLQPRMDRGELTVVVISSINGAQTQAALAALGCAAYLRKPIETSTLASTLASYMLRA